MSAIQLQIIENDRDFQNCSLHRGYPPLRGVRKRGSTVQQMVRIYVLISPRLRMQYGKLIQRLNCVYMYMQPLPRPVVLYSTGADLPCVFAA